jgi:hypothetical protein
MQIKVRTGKHIGQALEKVANFRVGTTEGFDSEWEELGARGLKFRQICRVQHWVQGVQYVVVNAEGKQCNRRCCCGAVSDCSKWEGDLGGPKILV